MKDAKKYFIIAHVMFCLARACTTIFEIEE